MASVGNAIYAKLSNDPNVTALVGTNIYPDAADMPNVFPHIIYEANGDVERRTTYAGDCGYAKVKSAILVIGIDYPSTDAVANAVIASLHSQGGKWGGVIVQRAFFKDDQEDDYQSADSVQWLYERQLTFDLHLTLPIINGTITTIGEFDEEFSNAFG